MISISYCLNDEKKKPNLTTQLETPCYNSFFTFDPADVAIFNSASSGDFTPQFKIKLSSKLWFV